MRRCALAACVLLLAGCGQAYAPKPAAPAQETLGVDANRMSMEARGVDLRLFDSRPTDGEARKPTLWLHADAFTLEEQNISSFQKARAMIYGRDAENSEITLDAGSGRFQEGKMAYLKDGVSVHIKDLAIQLEDFEWVNEERVGRTEHPVTVTSDALNLTASSMRLYPDKRQIQLTGASGTMRIEGKRP